MRLRRMPGASGCNCPLIGRDLTLPLSPRGGMNETTTGETTMIIDWLNTLKPYQARRVTLLYFPLLCWFSAAAIIRFF